MQERGAGPLRLRRLVLSVSVLFTGGPALACADVVTPAGDIRIEVVGRTERSATVTLTASRGDTVLPASQVSWSAEPPGAVEFITDGRARLLMDGTVTLRAALAGSTGALTLSVAKPPIIIFDLLRDGNRDIYRAALDGRDTARLTTHPGDDRDPTVAGGTVVFVSYRDGNGELYAIPVDGGPPARLTTTAANEADPALSPDGARLAYVRTTGGVPKLWVADDDGGNAVRVTVEFGFDGSIEASPGWSPRGDRIVFVSTAEGSADLFAYTMASGAVISLVADSGSSAEIGPAWSTDGASVAFASNRSGSTALYLVDVASGALTRLTEREGTDAEPGWLADGRLVYVAWMDGAARLRWLDPTAPDRVHEVPLGAGEPRRPVAVRD